MIKKRAHFYTVVSRNYRVRNLMRDDKDKKKQGENKKYSPGYVRISTAAINNMKVT
jgi:hypothetical protein